MKITSIIAAILVIVGALVWLPIGLFGFNLISAVFGGGAYVVARIIYSLVGIAAIWMIFFWAVYRPFSRID